MPPLRLLLATALLGGAASAQAGEPMARGDGQPLRSSEGEHYRQTLPDAPRRESLRRGVERGRDDVLIPHLRASANAEYLGSAP